MIQPKQKVRLCSTRSSRQDCAMLEAAGKLALVVAGKDCAALETPQTTSTKRPCNRCCTAKLQSTLHRVDHLTLAQRHSHLQPFEPICGFPGLPLHFFHFASCHPLGPALAVLGPVGGQYWARATVGPNCGQCRRALSWGSGQGLSRHFGGSHTLSAVLCVVLIVTFKKLRITILSFMSWSGAGSVRWYFT